LSEYLTRGLIERDPFVSLDQAGVGELIEIAVARGRKVRPKLKLALRRAWRDPDRCVLSSVGSITSHARRSALPWPVCRGPGGPQANRETD